MSKRDKSKKDKLPNANARSEQIPTAGYINGRKRRRSGGGYIRLDKPLTPRGIRDRYGLTYGVIDLNRNKFYVRHYEIPKQRKPIGLHAEGLLAAYLPRQMFLHAVNHRGLSKTFAGRAYLGLTSRQRCAEVYAECPSLRLLYRRFCCDVLVGMAKGEIPWGSETIPSELANTFYIALARGNAKFYAIFDSFLTDTKILLSDEQLSLHSNGDAIVHRQILNYIAFQRFVYRAKRRNQRDRSA